MSSRLSACGFLWHRLVMLIGRFCILGSTPAFVGGIVGGRVAETWFTCTDFEGKSVKAVSAQQRESRLAGTRKHE